jgi:phenylacetic acid degradation operon negative regulatory protein
MTFSPIEPILDHLRSTPSRTWSIAVTVFGDAVVPRGGSLWLGSLLEIFAGMQIGGGIVRTAMSRLATDGWLQRNRISRNSFYRLTERGQTSFAEAARRIYGAPPTGQDDRVRLLIATNGNGQEGVKAALESTGFGTISPGVWIGALSKPVPEEASGLLQLTGETDPATGRQLAERAWRLPAIGGAYDRFLSAFQPLRDAVITGTALGDLDSLVARTLLVHEYRRIVLRDPLLPASLLHENWPGRRARLLCAETYPALLPPSEAWLNRHGRAEDGPLPAPSADLHQRFQAA